MAPKKPPKYLRNRPVTVAEIGGNHGGDPELAARMVEAAFRARFDCVKFQAYRTDKFLHPLCPCYNELKNEELPFEAFGELARLARGRKRGFGLTVFGPEGLDLARDVKADYAKISSGDLDNLPLLEAAAKSGLPVVLSTGASRDSEIERALGILGGSLLAVLQCASLYPAPVALSNLAVMDKWLARGLPAGFSDHSEGGRAMEAAWLLGAAMIERHFTTDRRLPGGDNAMSVTSGRFFSSRKEARAVLKFLDECRAPDYRGFYDGPPPATRNLRDGLSLDVSWGGAKKIPVPGENPRAIRRFAVARTDLPAGAEISEAGVAYLRVPASFHLDSGPLLGPDEGPDGLVLAEPVQAGLPVPLSAVRRRDGQKIAPPPGSDAALADAPPPDLRGAFYEIWSTIDGRDMLVPPPLPFRPGSADSRDSFLILSPESLFLLKPPASPRGPAGGPDPAPVK
ncbi:MAG: N-acetylneuraminate synthase family protein [Deltaproteobacteria bacterium]|jgi:N-acetylneuraminate synthase/N,N'-diacetyllegionaminate synthase|nr:N-acetylneuraminate synthase family protein [Deltaproteobacteria bacterium]